MRLVIPHQRKGVIPKIPGFKTKKRQLSKGFQRALSKELDRVPERDEPDCSPSKTGLHLDTSFGAAIQIQAHSIGKNQQKPPLQKVMGHTKIQNLVERDGNILIVNTRRQQRAQDGSEFIDSAVNGADTAPQAESPPIHVTDHDEFESQQFEDSIVGQDPSAVPENGLHEDGSNSILNLNIKVSELRNAGEQPYDQKSQAEALADSRKSLVKSSLKSLHHRSSNENFANIKNQGLFIPN